MARLCLAAQAKGITARHIADAVLGCLVDRVGAELAEPRSHRVVAVPGRAGDFVATGELLHEFGGVRVLTQHLVHVLR